MKGLVVFGLLIYINDSEGGGRKGEQRKNKTSNSHKVLEWLYSESQEYPFLRTPIVSNDNIVIVSVFGLDPNFFDVPAGDCTTSGFDASK